MKALSSLPPWLLNLIASQSQALGRSDLKSEDLKKYYSSYYNKYPYSGYYKPYSGYQYPYNPYNYQYNPYNTYTSGSNPLLQQILASLGSALTGSTGTTGTVTGTTGISGTPIRVEEV